MKNLISSVSAVCLVAFMTTGCSQSPSPSIQELNQTAPVLFSGTTDHKYTTPSPPFILQGTCDPTAYGLQISMNNQSSWVDQTGGCPSNGLFSLNLNIPGIVNVYARERTKNGFTSTSHAYIRLVLPPTSPAYTLVASSQSDQEGGLGTQSSVNHNITGYTMNNGIKKMHMGAVGIVYGN